MAMHAISVKELRDKLPVIRSELKKGESFLIIYKSKPIAELKPIVDLSKYEEATDEQIERAATEDLNKFLPPITKEEYDYYMSLPPLKE
ncbi:hypothetical protein HYW83_01735 [Candidatus Peregrinibacteria bacterium]|nr:hypothetical protein [Candidatus Peregrinibacteria bacterium]